MDSKKNSFNNLAFTLAEILITIGIIGVVAALTIPNILTNYREKVVITRLKKVYSILNQAIALSEEKNGSCTTWDYGDENNHRDADFMEIWWKNYMDEYIPNIVTAKKLSTPTTSISGNGGYMLFLKDGTALRIESIPGSYLWIVMYVKPRLNISDFTSGATQKNMVSGRDYFAMFLMPDRKCAFDVDYYNDLNRASLIEACKSTREHGGTCFKLIKDNGWEIPSDYPIRF